jgi:hypothetical protein
LAKKPPPFPRRCAGKQRVTRHSGAFAAGQVSPSWVKAILYLISQLNRLKIKSLFKPFPASFSIASWIWWRRQLLDTDNSDSFGLALAKPFGS